MKVLHVGEYVKGGVATYINELLNYQRDCPEIDEVFLLMSDRNSIDLNNVNLKSENIFTYDYIRDLKHLLTAFFHVNKVINRIQPDIIHAHSTFAGLFVRLLFFFKTKRPKIVYCSHGWSFLMETSFIRKKIYKVLEKVLSIKTDIIINISLNEYNQAIKYGFPKNKSTVIFNGVSENENSLKQEVKVKLDYRKINLLFVGRFDRAKGLDILLKIFEDYNFVNTKLYIIGESVLGDQEIKKLNNVNWLGWVDHEHIDSYYQLFDAVIVPSRWEGFGLTAVEAMKNKKAVIVSNRGGLPELVDQNVNGYVFNFNQLNSLTKIIYNLDKTRLKDMGLKGYKMYQKKYKTEIMNKEILNQYVRVFLKQN